ncbi:MAG: PAS domain-containing protein, partial [Anaerolineae bacterium]|nr:PAS domain-containing protein [Anaerolineae bacterium]
LIVQRGMWRTVTIVLFPSQLFIIFAYALRSGEDGVNILYYMVFAMLWAGHFMSWRSWLLLIALNIALITVHGWAIPSISLIELYRSVGLFTLVAVGIAVVVRAYQGRSYMRFVTELAHAEANLRVTIEASHDGYYLMDAVKNKNGEVIDFKIIEINAEACKQLSMTREQLIGGLICELFPVNRQAGFFEQYKEVYLTGIAIEQEYYIPEGMAGTGWYYHQVVKTGDGVVIINREITQRKQFELDLVRRQNRLQSLIESQSTYLIRTDLQACYTFANQRFLDQFGYTEAEIIGTNSMDSIHIEDHAKTVETVTRCIQRPNTPIPVTLRKIGKDGSMMWTDWEFMAITSNMGDVLEIQCVGMDATSRINA